MEECPICLSSLENSSITMTGCCNKSMHSGCYFRCMALKPECPMCRAAQPPLEVVIPVPVAIPVTLQQESSHRKFISNFLGTVIAGIGLAVVIWTVETK